MTGQSGTFGAKPSAPDGTRTNRRLDSWKEIAAFFGRDERTVKRWEKERSLPVHRLPGGSRARVFAFAEELERWMGSLELASAQADDDDSAPEIEDAGLPAPEPAPPIGLKITQPVAPEGRSQKIWVVAVCALLAAGALLFWRYRPGHSTITAPVKAATHQVNPEAEELYLQGRYYWNRRTPADLTKAVDYFTQAIVRDPNYAQPYVGLADCYNLLREYAAMPNEEAFPRALAAAKKAVELDDSSAEAHASLAFVTFYWSWDIPAAEAEFRRAIELNPHYVAAHHWYATALMTMGRNDEAMREFEAAQKLDPSSAPILADKALLLFNEGHLDEAESILKQIESSQPGFSSAHRYHSYVLWQKHDYLNYLSESRQAAELAHDERDLAIVRAGEQGYRAGGVHGLLEQKLIVQKKLCAQGELSPFDVAQTEALLGNKAEALRYLQLAYNRHDERFLAGARNEALVSLHDEPEFRKLLQQAGLTLQ